MWKYYNPNPISARVGDCTVRAISRALSQTWEESYINLAIYGLLKSDMPSANHAWGECLKRNGFSRRAIDESKPDSYSVNDFCFDHPKGVYVVALDGHVVAVVDGDFYDSWDSGKEQIIYYWEKNR